MRRNRRGFSLIELMIAIVVIAIMFISALAIFFQTVHVQLTSEDQAIANNLARAAIEEVKSIRWSRIPLDSTGTGYLDPPRNTIANDFVTDDGELRVVRTIEIPETNIKRISVNVYQIDVSGRPGEQDVPIVTLVEDIYKFGM
ncbi:MAG: type II secretion system protein [bacterium]|jgi:prepilin-type N-terminal cleavage/methylation domain-containing protein